MNSNTFMKEKPVGRLIVSMALPMVLSMLVNSLYNIVDSYFVAQISDEAMTAVSLVFPLQNLINAVSIGFGVGINAAISYFLGAGEQEKADGSAAAGFACNSIHAVVMGLFFALIIPYFIGFYTSDALILEYAVSYGCTVFAFSFFYVGQMSFEKIFQAVGRMKAAMACVLTGSVINIILDPVLIRGLWIFPQMGIRGAALATGIGQTAPFFIYLYLLKQRPIPVSVNLRNISSGNGFMGEIIKKLYSVGVPATLNIALPSLLVSVLNAVLSQFGELYVLVLGVYYKLQTFIYLSANGLIQGIRPIVGYNYGAGEYGRVRSTYRISLAVSAAIMSVGTIICVSVPEELFSLFTESEQTAAAGAAALRIICVGFVVSAVSVTTSGVLEGLGKGKESLLISVLRYAVVIIPLAFILSRLLGAAGVWHAFWATEWICAAVSYLLYRREISMKYLKQ